MRFVVGVVAVAPFVALLIAMASGRAKVQSCCSRSPVDWAAAQEDFATEHARQGSRPPADQPHAQPEMVVAEGSHVASIADAEKFRPDEPQPSRSV